MPLLLHSRCPKPVQISGFGDMKPAVLCRHRRLLTQKEYSVWLIIRKLEQVATIEMPHYFSWFMAQTIYSPVCLFPYMKLQLEL